MWLCKGSNPREVTPIFSLFYIYSKQNLCFLFTNAKQQDNYMKRVAILFLLIFNELQANYMEMKVNCKTIIFNELQLYEMNCNGIKKRKSRCRNVRFNMLNPLSLFKIFLFLNFLSNYCYYLYY